MTVGSLVVSNAGRDKGRLHIIIAIDGNYVLLADGKWRKIESPKRKKIKHVLIADNCETPVGLKIANGQTVTNNELRRLFAELNACNPTPFEIGG